MGEGGVRMRAGRASCVSLSPFSSLFGTLVRLEARYRAWWRPCLDSVRSCVRLMNFRRLKPGKEVLSRGSESRFRPCLFFRMKCCGESRGVQKGSLSVLSRYSVGCRLGIASVRHREKGKYPMIYFCRCGFFRSDRAGAGRNTRKEPVPFRSVV